MSIILMIEKIRNFYYEKILKAMRYMISHCHIVYEINNNGLSNALLSLLEKKNGKWLL